MCGLRGSNMRDDKLASGGWVSMGMLHPQQSIPIVHKNTQRNEVVKQMETASLWCAHSERVSSSSCTLELAQHCKLQLHTKGREKMISYANAAEGGWGAPCEEARNFAPTRITNKSHRRARWLLGAYTHTITNYDYRLVPDAGRGGSSVSVRTKSSVAAETPIRQHTNNRTRANNAQTLR